jgi:hypothetical protein
MPQPRDDRQLLSQPMPSLRGVLNRVDAFLKDDLLQRMFERFAGVNHRLHIALSRCMPVLALETLRPTLHPPDPETPVSLMGFSNAPQVTDWHSE